MGVDSDKTNAAYKPLMDKARRAAETPRKDREPANGSNIDWKPVQNNPWKRSNN